MMGSLSLKYTAWSSFILQTGYPAGTLYYATAGNATFSVVPINDTTKILFNRSFSLKPKIYTLYLSGTVAALDTMLIEEINYPNIITAGAGIPPTADSVVNIRFVNLSSGSPALKIKLATGTTNEVDNLPYKAIGSWKAYANKTEFTTYSFQIRDAATDALITTYNFSATATNRFKNVALVIRGAFGTTGTTGFGVSAINYF